MALYEFTCLGCKKEYEEVAKHDPEGHYSGVVCPACGSDRKTKQMSRCSFAFANPVGTDRWSNSHDYRYQHQVPGVAAQRENAAARSHMGANPYGSIDDISSGSNFGEVK